MVKATCRVLFVCMTISGVFCNPALAASRPKFTIVIIKSICPKLYCHLPSPLPFMRLLELCSFAGRSPKVFCLASCTNLREKALEHPLFRHLYHISVFSDSLESEITRNRARFRIWSLDMTPVPPQSCLTHNFSYGLSFRFQVLSESWTLYSAGEKQQKGLQKKQCKSSLTSIFAGSLCFNNIGFFYEIPTP